MTLQHRVPILTYLRTATWAGLMVMLAGGGALAAGIELAEEAGGDGVPSRYAEVLDAADGSGDGFQRQIGAELVTFDSAETDALVATGWQPPAQGNLDDFADRGERVRTFVAIAEALGLDPAIGVEQANWGTPQENGLMDLARALAATHTQLGVSRYDLAELTRHREDVAAVLAELRIAPQAEDSVESRPETIEALVSELVEVDRRIAETQARAAALEEEVVSLESSTARMLAHVGLAKTGPAGWELVNLDVNGDAVVNQADLEAALSGMRPEAHADGAIDG